MKSEKQNKAVERRLTHLRGCLGYRRMDAFADFLGISKTRWNNFECGFPLSKDAAFLLVQKVPGLTLDWLYFGKTAGLSMQLSRWLGLGADTEGEQKGG